MPLGAGPIDTYRNRERTQLYIYLGHVALGALAITQTVISGVQVRIRSETGNALQSLHQHSITSAITSVVNAGFNLPPLDFYLCTNQQVPNVAMKTYTANNSTPVVLLGPRMWAKNPMLPGTANNLVGGVGTNGARGVANQVYDGTQRWFGNPKQKAQGATIVMHELGHVLHEMTNPGIFWEEQQAVENQQPSPNGAGWPAASVSVSNYAGNNALEFVAEVFAGRLVGKVYAAGVMNVYHALGGPVFL